MKIKEGNFKDNFQSVQVKLPIDSIAVVIAIVGLIALLTFILGIVAVCVFTTQQMYIIWPMLAAGAIFLMFSVILKFRMRVNLFGEIGFIYLALALAYTVLPAIKFLRLDFNFPIDFDQQYFAILSPQPAELGMHFWRHVLFIAGVIIGFLIVRSRPLLVRPLYEKSSSKYGRIIFVLLAIMGCCIFVRMSLSTSVTSYYEHYTRFDSLSWPLRRIVYICGIYISAGYFVLLSLMFSKYRKYKIYILLFVSIICAYEVVYSFGARIIAFTILLAVYGFYHYKVSPLSLKKGIVILIALAILFYGIGVIRHNNYNLEDAQNMLKDKNIKISEFDSVYCTGFHLYFERGGNTLPTKQWQMFFHELISVIPFVDHTKYNPQYWYARNYFPEAVVPPTTMGVIADSAIWGGEFDLFLRSLINGAFFALLTRWFLRRREKWWALTAYIFCYANCIFTLKYSVFYLFTPIIRMLLPILLLTGILMRVLSNPMKPLPIDTYKKEEFS